MNEQRRSGGIHLGNVGQGVKLQAGGDIVGGNKTTTTSSGGFGSDQAKAQFQSELELLRELLRETKAQIEASRELSTDDKDELVAEVLEHVKALKGVKEETAALKPGQAAPATVTKGLESQLDRAGTLLDKVHSIAGKSADVAAKVGALVAKYGPLALSLRGLFGLP